MVTGSDEELPVMETKRPVIVGPEISEDICNDIIAYIAILKNVDIAVSLVARLAQKSGANPKVKPWFEYPGFGFVVNC